MWADRRTLSRLAFALWILFGLAAGSAVFDHGIRVAAQRYLWQEYDGRMHGRPGLRIDEVMRPAARRSAAPAIAAGGGIILLGATLIALARRR